MKDKRNTRTAIANVVRALVAAFISSVIGYLFYMVLINSPNVYIPALIIYSLAVFAFSIFLFVKILTLPTKDERKISEREEIAKRHLEAGYSLDYKAYFKEQLKCRMWGVPLVIFLTQLPLVVNWAMVDMAEGFTVYTSPIPFYKFSAMSLFVWESLGSLWYFAPIIFTAVFTVAFCASLWFYQKSFIPNRPSWME